MEKKMKKRWGDRYDGRRVRHGDPTNIIIPFLMKERSDSQVFFDAEIDVSKVDALILEKRKEGQDIGFLDYLLAVLVRTISQYPRMNRFIAGRRIFARDAKHPDHQRLSSAGRAASHVLCDLPKRDPLYALPKGRADPDHRAKFRKLGHRVLGGAFAFVAGRLCEQLS